MMSRDDVTTHLNPEHSLERRTMPELRKILGPLVSPDNPLSESEARTKHDPEAHGEKGAGCRISPQEVW